MSEHDDIDAGRGGGDLAGARQAAGDVKQPDDHPRTLGAQRANGRARRRRRIRDGHVRRRRPPLPDEIQNAEHAHDDLAGPDDPACRKQRAPVFAHDVRRHDRDLGLVAQSAPFRGAERQLSLPDRDRVETHSPIRPQREACPSRTRRRIDEARLVLRRRRDIARVDPHHGRRREPRPIDPGRHARQPAGGAGRRRHGAAQVGRVNERHVGGAAHRLATPQATGCREQEADDAASPHPQHPKTTKGDACR